MARGYQISVTPVTLLAHLLLITVAILLFVWLLDLRDRVAFNSSNKSKIFNLHPLLMVIGFILFGGEAIMAFKTIPAKRGAVKVVHLLLHLISLVTGIWGIIVIFKFKKEIYRANMYTLHSRLGISAISLFGLQYIWAFFAYFFLRVKMSTKATLLPWHRFFAMGIFLLAICTAEIVFVEAFSSLGLFCNQEALTVNFTALLLFLFGVCVSFSIILPSNY